MVFQSLKFNGESIENAWLEREKLIQSGTLVVEMDSAPNKDWGVDTPPPSMSYELTN